MRQEFVVVADTGASLSAEDIEAALFHGMVGMLNTGDFIGVEQTHQEMKYRTIVAQELREFADKLARESENASLGVAVAAIVQEAAKRISSIQGK